MAAARDPLLSSQERSNSAKLGKLIFHEGTVVLRSLFDAHLSPLRLKNHLTILRSLRDSNLISPGEWKVLFPDDGSSPTSQNMEAHLLFVLLQNICGLPKPSFGLDKQPSTSTSNSHSSVEDYHVSRNLDKFYSLITEVASRTTSLGVEYMFFDIYWSEITNVVTNLGSHKYFLFAYEKLKQEPMDKDDEDKYHRLLVEWADREKKIKYQDVAAHFQDTTEKINSIFQRQDETKLQLVQGLKMPFTWSNSSRIGTGCKGTKVYHGQLTSDGRQVAVMKISKRVFDMREAESLRKWKHPEEEFFYRALELETPPRTDGLKKTKGIISKRESEEPKPT